MAVRPDSLCTLAQLKSAVGIAPSDLTKDSYLEQCIDRASWLIEDMTGRKFNEGMGGGLKARKYTDITTAGTHATTGVANEDYVYFSGWTLDRGGDTVRDGFTGEGLFYLPAYPVRPNSETGSLTFALAVLESRDSSAETWDTNTHVENETFILDRQNGVLRLLGGPFTGGHRNYRVTMAAGFLHGAAQPYVPPDLEMLCVELAKGLFRDNRGVTAESIGTWSRSFSAARFEEDPFIQQTLARYTRPVL